MAVGNQLFSDKLLNEFEEQLHCSNSLSALRSMMDSNLSNLGFAAYAYVRIAVETDGACKIQGLTNYPSDWCEHYRDADYFAVDPTLWYCESELRPVAWHQLSEIQKHKGIGTSLFDEARGFGLRDGITVPLHAGNRWLSAMNVVTDLGYQEAIRLVMAHMDMVQIMAILFHGIAEERIRASKLSFPRSRQSDTPIRGFRAPGGSRRVQ
jgi:hypothetical protein